MEQIDVVINNKNKGQMVDWKFQLKWSGGQSKRVG